MSVSKSQIEASKRYIAKTYDDIKIRVSKGMREEYQKKAIECGYASFNSFVIDAINEKISKYTESEKK